MSTKTASLKNKYYILEWLFLITKYKYTIYTIYT